MRPDGVNPPSSAPVAVRGRRFAPLPPGMLDEPRTETPAAPPSKDGGAAGSGRQDLCGSGPVVVVETVEGLQVARIALGVVVDVHPV